MAIMDSKLVFSDAQTLASLGASSAVNSTNLVDLGAQGYGADFAGVRASINQRAGEGNNLIFNVQINTVLVGAAADVKVGLYTDGALSSSHLSTAVHLVDVIFPAVAAAGTKYSVSVPSGDKVERYLEVQYIVNTSGKTVTSGKIDSWIGLDHDSAIAVKK